MSRSDWQLRCVDFITILILAALSVSTGAPVWVIPIFVAISLRQSRLEAQAERLKREFLEKLKSEPGP